MRASLLNCALFQFSVHATIVWTAKLLSFKVLFWYSAQNRDGNVEAGSLNVSSVDVVNGLIKVWILNQYLLYPATNRW